MPLKNIDEIKYYIKISEILRLTRDELKVKIKNKEYERIDDVAKNKLINDEQANINDFIKNPILLKNKHNYDVVSEKMLQKIILEDIPSFLDELGIGFTFIKNEYKIKIDDEYNYIDLLLFNYEYNCFVVVELKTTKLQKDHIGQIQVYMNYINKNLKKPFQTDTIGIIICKKSNKFIIEYCSDIRVLGREYKIIS